MRFFLLQLLKGVAEEAVKLKMKVEGLDPQLLNDPNAPAPPADENSESSSDSDWTNKSITKWEITFLILWF